MKKRANSIYKRWIQGARALVAVALSVFMLLFSNASREWLHHFASHHDTMHTHADDLRKGTAIESQHHHCQFLDIPLPVFLQANDISQVTTPVASFRIFNILPLVFYFDSSPSTSSSRGPPAHFPSFIV